MAARNVGFKVQGLNQVVRALKDLGLEADDLKAAFSTLAREGAQAAERYAPRRSGRLAASIRGNRAQSKAVVSAGRASVPYAGPINYGWQSRGIAPSGFMQKADEDMRPRAIQVLEDELNKQIKAKNFK